MSVSESKAVAEQLVDAFNANDLERIGEVFSADFVNHNPAPVPGLRGDRDGQLTIMRMFRHAFPDARAEVVNLIAEEDRVVLHDIVRGTHEGEFMGATPTGKEVTVEFIHIFRVADGQIAERWGLVDVMGLMQQIGAAPQMAPA